jgi:pyruvate dehydrogenase E1 component
VTLLGSGAILTEVLGRRSLAAEGWHVDVVSVTSWSELARDGQACEQRALQGDADPGTPWIAQVLAGTRGPVVAATDYVRAVPESVPRLPARRPALPDAGHRRLRPQRHARRAAAATWCWRR